MGQVEGGRHGPGLVQTWVLLGGWDE